MVDITVDKIIRARRRTVSMQIMSDASLVVKIPWFFPKSQVERFVKEKEDWIREKQQEMRQRKKSAMGHQYTSGELFSYLGKTYVLEVTHKTNEPLEFKNGFFLNTFNQKKAAFYLENWYKKQAIAVITSRVKLYANRHGLSYGTISLSSATTRWGSCTHDNNLFFNWTLIMAPMEVIDYVVVHELSHTVEKNHSRKFWQHVSKMFTEFRPYRRWLKEKGHTLHI